MRDSQQTCAASSLKPRSSRPRRNLHRRRPSGRRRRHPPAAPKISWLRPTGEEVKDKTRYAALAVGGELVARGEVELGFFNLSEIPKGVTVAGALPGPLQGYTVYEAAVLSKRSTAGAVTAFVKYLASAAVAAHWSGAKLEPAETYMRTRASQ